MHSGGYPLPERKGDMKRILIILTILILSVSSAFALVTHKSYPDYEIQVSMYVYLPQSTTGGSMTWISTVKLKDMLTKQYVKAWNVGDSLLDLNLAGGGTLTSHQTKPDNSTNPSPILSIAQYQNFYDAYKVISSDVFKIAKLIQTAGKIPVIKFGKIDLIGTNGLFYMTKEIQPTGASQ